MASGSVRERAPKGVTVIWNKQEIFIINLFYTNDGGFIIARSFLHIHQLGTCGPCPLLPLHQNFPTICLEFHRGKTINTH